MVKYKTNINKFPSAILEESKKLLKKVSYNIEVETDHSITFIFKENKEITTTLLFNFDGNLLNYTCDCGSVSLCKHVGAALLILEERKNKGGNELTYNEFDKIYSAFIKTYISSNAIQIKINTLLESYSIDSIANCLTEAFFDTSMHFKTRFFAPLFQLFEFSRLSDKFIKLLKQFLTNLIHRYNDIDNSIHSKIDQSGNNNVFLKLFETQIYGSSLIDEVYVNLLNEGIFPKNVYLNSFLSYETYLSSNNGDKLTPRGLETLFNNQFNLNNNYPISNLEQHNLLNEIVNSDDAFYYFTCLYEISQMFNIDKISIAKNFFLLANKIPEKIDDCKKLLLYISKNSDVVDFIDDISNEIDFNNKFWTEFVSTIASPYSLCNQNSSQSFYNKLDALEKDISLEDLTHLIDVRYPFYLFKSFFKNKKLVLNYDNVPIDQKDEISLLASIIKHREDLPKEIDTIIQFYDSLPLSIIEEVFYKIPYYHAKTLLEFNLIDKVGFKKI